jgi:hypothetical protein
MNWSAASTPQVENGNRPARASIQRSWSGVLDSVGSAMSALRDATRSRSLTPSTVPRCTVSYVPTATCSTCEATGSSLRNDHTVLSRTLRLPTSSPLAPTVRPRGAATVML